MTLIYKKTEAKSIHFCQSAFCVDVEMTACGQRSAQAVWSRCTADWIYWRKMPIGLVWGLLKFFSRAEVWTRWSGSLPKQEAPKVLNLACNTALTSTPVNLWLGLKPKDEKINDWWSLSFSIARCWVEEAFRFRDLLHQLWLTTVWSNDAAPYEVFMKHWNPPESTLSFELQTSWALDLTTAYKMRWDVPNHDCDQAT